MAIQPACCYTQFFFMFSGFGLRFIFIKQCFLNTSSNHKLNYTFRFYYFFFQLRAHCWLVATLPGIVLWIMFFHFCVKHFVVFTECSWVHIISSGHPSIHVIFCLFQMYCRSSWFFLTLLPELLLHFLLHDIFHDNKKMFLQ